ncbi:MAG: GEVED domain-containing protein [Bacteroidia bacterium]|nr:GEVED domain-containing protein [Bacteroidia bacterium]
MQVNKEGIREKIYILLFIISVNTGFSQTPNWAWADKAFTQAGGNSTGKAIAVDNNGNVYVTGSFSGTVNFPGYSLTSSGLTDIYLVKYDNNGTLQWAVKAGGISNDDGRGICVDNAGYVYITGFITDNATFGSTSTSGSSTGSGQDIFVAKYSTSGVFQTPLLKRVTGGTGAIDRGNGIAVDGSGNLFVTGAINGTQIFGNGDTLITSDQDAFIFKMNSTGNTIWAKKGGSNGSSNGNDEGMSVCIDASGSPYVTGYFSTIAYFNPNTCASAGSHDIFTVKYNPSNGLVTWLKQAGGNNQDDAYNITYDNTAPGYVYITGAYKSTPAFFGSYSVNSNGISYDVFVAKYAVSDGNCQWVINAGGTNDDIGKGIIIDASGNPIITGTYSNPTCTFGALTPLTSFGNSDIFIAKCNSSGTWLWVKSAGGSSTEDATSVGVYSCDIFTTGSYTGAALFGSIPLNASSSPDGFVAKLTSGPVIAYNIISPVLCNGYSNAVIALTVSGAGSPFSYSWSNGLTTDTVSNLQAGTYMVTVTSGNCVSTQSIPLTQPTAVISTDSVTQVSCNNLNGAIDLTVSGGSPPYVYLWSNGATTQDISGLSSGIYSVTITDSGGCSSSKTDSLINPTYLPIQLSLTNSIIACHGGFTNVNLTVGCGLPPIHYIWSNGATTQNLTNVLAGCYNVTVYDSNITVNTFSWSYSYYTDNHIIAILNTIPLTINGSPVANGDYIGVFYNDGGVLKCGGYELWSGISTAVTAMGDDPTTTTVKEGFINGESFNWKVWHTSLGIAVNMTATYSNLQPNQGNYYSGGLSALTSLTGTYYTGQSTTGSICITDPLVLQASNLVLLPVSCYGGNNGLIFLTVSGGTSPYTYHWSNNANTPFITNLTAGTYSYTVTDAHLCTFTNSVDITQPALLTVSGTVFNVTCNGLSNGSITCSVSGGTLPYFYHWNTSQTTLSLSGITAGNYVLTVTDAEGCLATSSFSVTQPAPLVNYGLDVNQGNISCYNYSDGTISVLPHGGATPYTVTLDGIPAPMNADSSFSFYALMPGTHFGIITDANGCLLYYSPVITQPAQLSISLNNTVNILCYGAGTGAIDISVAGGTSPYTYVWSNATTTQDLTAITAGNYCVTVSDANNCKQTACYTITQVAAMTLTDSLTNVICDTANGAIHITVTGGTSPYTYHWSNNATTQNLNNLSPNNYSLTVTDAHSCILTATYQIVQLAPRLTVSSIARQNCYGQSNGSIHIIINDGTPPFTFTWNTYTWSTNATTQDLTGLTAGTYCITVTDANLCLATACYIISQPTLIQISVTDFDNVTCFNADNGNIEINVTGGITAYSYHWSYNDETTHNLNNLPSGTYHLTVTDANSCIMTATYIITQPAALTITTGLTNVQCNGNNNGAIDITVTGGTSPYTYLWNNGTTIEDRTNLAPGTYSVTVTDVNGCTATATATLTQPAVLTISDVINNVTCYGLTNGSVDITPAGGTTPYAYHWSTGATTQNLTGLAANIIYCLTVTDSNNCTISACYSVSEPSTMYITSPVIVDASCININNGSIDFNLTGGTAPYTYLWNNSATTQDLQNLTAGNYALTITDHNGCILTSSYSVGQNLTLNIIPGNDTTIYQGSNLYLFGGYHPGYNYHWSTGSTAQTLMVDSAGTYSVTITDPSNGCQNADSVIVTTIPANCQALAGNNFSICYGDSISLSGAYTATNVSYINVCSSCIMSNSYCPSFGDSSSIVPFTLQKITDVRMNGSSNPSDSSLYSDFTSSLFTVLQKGNTYQLKVTSWRFDQFLYQYWAYIDWNRDGDFADASEQYFIGSSSVLGYATLQTSITAPANAIPGQTRMRIIGFAGVSPGPCITYFDGETEDYKIEVTELLPYLPQFSWSGNGIPVSANQVTQVPDVTHSGCYHLQVSFGFGCTSEDSVCVTVNPLPQPVITGPAPVCKGSTVIYSTQAGMTGYTWSVSSGGTITGGSGTNTITVTWATAGPQTVSVNYTDGNGCTAVSPTVLPVTVNPLPVTQPIVHSQ